MVWLCPEYKISLTGLVDTIPRQWREFSCLYPAYVERANVMYNEKLKRKFIVECVPPASVCSCVDMFNSFEKYENEWDADLCTKSPEELTPLVESLIGLRGKSGSGKRSLLKRYIKWCIESGVPDACDGLKYIDKATAEKIRKQTVANPKHLQAYLDACFLPEDMHTIDNLLRGYYWFAYAGFYEDDIFELRCSDIDLIGMKVYYKRLNKHVPIYVEGLESIRNCKELTSFVIPHPLYTTEVSKPRVPGDLVMRGTKGNLDSHLVRVAISKKSKGMKEKVGTRLSYSRVWLSGIFYRAQEIERFRLEPDFTEYVEGELATGDEVKSLSYKSRKNRLEKEIKEDYERWKLAWGF